MLARVLVVFFAVSACRERDDAADRQPSAAPMPAAVVEEKPMRAPSAPAAPEPELAREMPPASGTVAGRSFTAKKGIFRRSAERDTLDFWDSAMGHRCEHQVALEGASYLSLSPRSDVQTWALGRVYSEEDVLTSSRTDGTLERPFKGVSLVVDEIDEADAVVRGRLRVEAADDTAYSGSFEAAYCPNGVVARERGGTIAGVRWGEPPAARDLPDALATAELGGRPAAILHPGFLFALGEKPKVGDVIEYHGGSVRDAVPPTYALLNARMHEYDPFTSYGEGDAIVIVDAIDRKRIRGRVYAAFRDPGKSMVVGRFDAPICADADVQ